MSITRRKPTLDKEGLGGFGEGLEVEAVRILERGKGDPGEPSLLATVEREIALTVDQLEQVRRLDEELRHSLLKLECYIGTERMQMEQRTPRYSPDRFPEREKLQRRLHRVGEERRRLAVSTDEKVRGMQDRLLTLLERHRHMRPHREDKDS